MPNQLKGEMLRKSKADRKSFAQMPRNELYVLLDGLKSAHQVFQFQALISSIF